MRNVLPSDSLSFYCDDGWYSNHSRQRMSTYVGRKQSPDERRCRVCGVQTGSVTWCEWGGASVTRSRRRPLINLRALSRLTQAWLPWSRLQSLQSNTQLPAAAFTMVMWHCQQIHLSVWSSYVLYVWTCWWWCCRSVSFIIAAIAEKDSERWGEVLRCSIPLFALQVLRWSLPSHTVEIQIYTTV